MSKNLDKKIEELKKQIENIDIELSVLRKNWAADVKDLSNNPDFDMYSKKGERELVKIGEKYVPLFADIEEKRFNLVEEHNKLIDERNLLNGTNN